MEYSKNTIMGIAWKLLPNPTKVNGLIGRPPNYSRGFLICENPTYTLYDPPYRPDDYTLYSFLELFNKVQDPDEAKVRYYYTNQPSDVLPYVRMYIENYLCLDGYEILGMVKDHLDIGYFDYLGIDNYYYRDIFYKTAMFAADMCLTQEIIDRCRKVYDSDPRSSNIEFKKFLVNVFDDNAMAVFKRDDTARFSLNWNDALSCYSYQCSNECRLDHIVPFSFFLSNWTTILGVQLNLLAHGECTFGIYKL